MANIAIKEALLKTAQATKKYVDDKVESINLTDLEVTNSISMGRLSDTTIGEKSVAVGYDVEASGEGSHAEGSNTTASGYISHAEGKYTEASGYISHAEGYYTEASGDYSHAEGSNTKATGNCSHVEGSDAKATGNYSHAEGSETTASEYASHAEGSNTIASNFYSHAEGGNTIASGWISHAEGENTTASGRTSHAEGYYTTAGSMYQHVQGKYNINDTENKYAHIVGNGTADNARSNAHTLDWDGNAWFAGDVKVGGTNQDDAEKLATEIYVNNAVSGIVDSAPEALNTLNELAQALGDNPNFATTIANQIGQKADASVLNNYALKTEIPTVTNDLTNDLKAKYDAAYTHSQAAHAPSDAQKNSDITKAEIEAKLTGDITSHTHSAYATTSYVDSKLSAITMMKISQVDYDALTTKDPNTLYLIVG